MLANMYIGTGKYDLAEELCQRCLNYNQGCGLAHERMGLIKEKEGATQTRLSTMRQPGCVRTS